MFYFNNNRLEKLKMIECNERVTVLLNMLECSDRVTMLSDMLECSESLLVQSKMGEFRGILKRQLKTMVCRNKL